MPFTSKSQIESQIQTATIEADESLSNSVDISRFSKFALQMPSEWTEADISFVSDDDNIGTFLPVKGADGLEIVVEAEASEYVSIDIYSSVFEPLHFIKLRSGTASVPIAQESERQIKIIMKK